MLKDLKILLVDDDQDYKTSVRSLLESRGCTVVEADSAKDGLRKLVEYQPDLVVLDIMMDYSTDGYGVNQAIKFQDAYAAFRRIPIVMVSSIEQSPDELYPMAAEVEMIRPDYYLTKPLDIPKFLQVLETAAGRLPSRPLSAA